MSSEGGDENKSEQATQYKLEQARKKGMIPRSQELGLVVTLVVATVYLWLFGDQMLTRLMRINARALAESGSLNGGGHALITWMAALMRQAIDAVSPLIAIVAIGALASAVLQTGFLFAPGALKMDWTKLNPAQGFKRVFSMETLTNAGKAFVKIAVYTTIAYVVISHVAITVSHDAMSPAYLANILKSSGLKLMAYFLSAAAFFALVDQIIVRRAFAKKMRMSKYEQKQEMKNRDGDPRIKQRRKQLQRELLKRSTGMKNVRGADVMVVNPTHYAVALKYDAKTMSAPTIVAKGSGDFALRLKKIAFIYGVPVVESPVFARQLFFKTRLEQEIPAHLYSQTATVYLAARRSTSQTKAA